MAFVAFVCVLDCMNIQTLALNSFISEIVSNPDFTAKQCLLHHGKLKHPSVRVLSQFSGMTTS